MELQQLRYALAVGKTGNFSRAAEECHVSQPSLSQQVQKLEQELGIRLFTRLKRQTVPTAAGTAFLVHAARVLTDLEVATAEAKEAGDHASGAIRGVVNLGVLPTIAPYLLPRALALCRQRHPQLDIIVQETNTTHLLAMAAACEIDLAVLSLPIRDARFECEELFTEELWLAVPPEHLLAKKRKPVSLDDVGAERFILLQEGHCLGDQALRFCNSRECHPNIIFRTAQLETIQALVASGLGVSLIPQMAIGTAHENHPVYLRLTAPRPQRVIALLWRKEHHLTRAAAALAGVLRTIRFDQASR
jgi:LysR family hydrogen peroxide-inducible transcriptional activator